ncbi:MAG: protoheme IX farnesyltransferase [Bdellovibrionaceae bacterium]|nr:protoheme IX farnesyltransferase [Pseudobdellovibrionaceae bacterium]
MLCLKDFLVLSKFRIVVFVLISALLAYVCATPVGAEINFGTMLLFFIALYLFSSGIFILNQVQEVHIDAKMLRTSQRPLVLKTVSVPWALSLSIFLTSISFFLFFLINKEVLVLAVIGLLLYNGFYTLWWKKKWAFAAVPGAIPGAMPVCLAYVAGGGALFSSELYYLFLIMFLWQMPHFWYLALHYKEDYSRGNIPVLPVIYGDKTTLYQMGIYTFIYIGLALLAPVYIPSRYFYLLLVIPVSFKLLYEFFHFFSMCLKNEWKINKATGKRQLAPFFMWINISLLVFLAAPVLDKLLFYFTARAQ